MDPLPHRQNQHRRRAINRIASYDLIPPLTQNRPIAVRLHLHDRKDRPDGHVHVQIGRPIQRIKVEDVIPRLRLLEPLNLIHLLGDQRGHMATVKRLKEDIVCHDIERLLRLALNVRLIRLPKVSLKRHVAHMAGNTGTARRDIFDQENERRISVRGR